MLVWKSMNAIFSKDQKPISSLTSYTGIMQTNYMHGFEDKNNLTWQLLQQEAYLLEVNFIFAFKKFNLFFRNRST